MIKKLGAVAVLSLSTLAAGAGVAQADDCLAPVVLGMSNEEGQQAGNYRVCSSGEGDQSNTVSDSSVHRDHSDNTTSTRSSERTTTALLPEAVSDTVVGKAADKVASQL